MPGIRLKILSACLLLTAALHAAPALAQPQPATPAESAAKYQADLDAFNDLHSMIVLPDNFGEYLAASRHWLQPGVKASDDVRFVFTIPPFDSAERKLAAAQALPGAVADLDGPAADLLQALKTLDPILRKMSRYADSHGYEDDDFKMARETHPALVAAVGATLAADKRLQAALSNHAIAEDSQQVAEMPAGLPHDMLADRLAVRTVERLVRNLKAGDDTAALASAVSALAAANAQLADTLDKLSPPAEGNCGSYLHHADVLLGSAREQMHSAKAGDDPKQPIDEFHDDYPTAMGTLDLCQRFEPRAKP